MASKMDAVDDALETIREALKGAVDVSEPGTVSVGSSGHRMYVAATFAADDAEDVKRWKRLAKLARELDDERYAARNH